MKMNDTLLLGVSRKIITPKVGGKLMGYQPDLRSESVNDDLTACVYYFKEGATKALLVSASLCGIGTDICNGLRREISERFDIPYEAMIIHTFHTHSGPTLMNISGWGEADYEYLEEILRPQLMEAVAEAIDTAEPVTMAVASGDSLVGVNRREITVKNHINLGQSPWGPFDPQMTVISFKNDEGKRVANLIHYGAHPTASGMNKEITRDWPGPMMDAVEEIFGGVTAFFNGPEGDVGPRLIGGKTTGGFNAEGKFENHVKYALRHGALAAQDAVKIAHTASGYSRAHLTVSTYTIDIPVKKRLSIEEATAIYEENKQYTANLPARKAAYAKGVLESYENGYEEITSRPFTQTAVMIGDVVFVTFPFELFSEIGLRIRRASKIPYTLTLALSNGVSCYFPTETEINRCAVPGYEVESFKVGDVQPYVDNADFTLVRESLNHLASLGYERHPQKAFEFDENATK